MKQASISTKPKRSCGLRWVSLMVFALSVGVLLFSVQAWPAMADEHGSMSHEGPLHDADPPTAVPDEYSLFMHHSSGLALIVLAILVLSGLAFASLLSGWGSGRICSSVAIRKAGPLVPRAFWRVFPCLRRWNGSSTSSYLLSRSPSDFGR